MEFHSTDNISKPRGSKNSSAVFKNIGWLSIERIFRLTTSLFIGAWVARYLGPESFGILAYSLSFAAIFSFISILGLEQIVVRELVKRPHDKNTILGTAFFLRLFGGVLSVVLAITWLHNFEPNDKELLKYVTIIVIGNAFQAFDVIDAYFQSQILSRNSVVAKTFAFIIVCIVKVVLILNNCSLLYFTVAVLLEIILSSLFIVFSYRYCRHHILKWKFSLLEAKSLMKFAWPLMSGILFVNIYMRIDQIMIGSFIDKSALGVYSVAVSLSQIWYFFPMAIVRSIFPLIVSLRSNNYALYHAHLLRLYSVMFWLGVAAGLFFTLLGNYIITTLYGSAFTGAYSVLVINIWGGIFVSQSLARGNWLISENYQNYRLIVQIFLAAFNVILNVILIPKYGLRGAALASVLSQAVCIWGITLLIRPLRNSTISMLKAINPIFLFRVPSGEKA